MWKGLLLLVVLAGAGYLVYRLVRPAPEKSVCEKVGELCGGGRDVVERCGKAMAELKKAVGDEAVAKAAACTSGSRTCPDALGCVTGSVLDVGAGEFLKGLDRALSK